MTTTGSKGSVVTKSVVTMREFSRNVYDYLKGGEYVLTRNGVEVYEVRVEEILTNNVVTGSKKKVVKKLREDLKGVVAHSQVHGCGCRREVGHGLCRAHGRY